MIVNLQMGKKDSLDYDAEIKKMEERLDKLAEGIRMEESRIGGKLDDLMRAVRHNNCKVGHVNRDIRNSKQGKQKPTANMSESDAIMKQLGKVYGTFELAENLDEALRRINEAHIVLQRFLSASSSQSTKLQIENFLVHADEMKRILTRIVSFLVFIPNDKLINFEFCLP
ncbi:hypothetical protein WR25_15053 isoform B [Diploscapter pachys]|uniref:Uncharacterized protein n=1 Tax=Diploscapter pachys TaxID=2018661 RepID=A0A2A2L0P9_9BILA|nr:hypothetical protein WR25_15053 isoform B [Diploscapter pachys]